MTSSVQEMLRRHEQELLNHPQVRAAVEELEGIIRHRYPDAEFFVQVADDPYGVHIFATVDVDDTDEVTDLYLERIMELQVEERIPVYVMTRQPRERWLQDVRANGIIGHSQAG